MGFVELFLIGIGLAMDAFAVSICKGLKMPELKIKDATVIALFFGGFQALMPFIGWAAGKNFEKYITEFDHWIAFLLLLFIGGKMAVESFKKDDEDSNEYKFDIKELLLLAVATSIDALAVGITFAFLKVSIVFAILVIGTVTFIISLLGVFVGHRFGSVYKNKAEFFGGIVLILIGVKILLEHLGIIDFKLF